MSALCAFQMANDNDNTFAYYIDTRTRASNAGTINTRRTPQPLEDAPSLCASVLSVGRVAAVVCMCVCLSRTRVKRGFLGTVNGFWLVALLCELIYNCSFTTRRRRRTPAFNTLVVRRHISVELWFLIRRACAE